MIETKDIVNTTIIPPWDTAKDKTLGHAEQQIMSYIGNTV